MRSVLLDEVEEGVAEEVAAKDARDLSYVAILLFQAWFSVEYGAGKNFLNENTEINYNTFGKVLEEKKR